MGSSGITVGENRGKWKRASWRHDSKTHRSIRVEDYPLNPVFVQGLRKTGCNREEEPVVELSLPKGRILSRSVSDGPVIGCVTASARATHEFCRSSQSFYGYWGNQHPITIDRIAAPVKVIVSSRRMIVERSVLGGSLAVVVPRGRVHQPQLNDSTSAVPVNFPNLTKFARWAQPATAGVIA